MSWGAGHSQVRGADRGLPMGHGTWDIRVHCTALPLRRRRRFFFGPQKHRNKAINGRMPLTHQWQDAPAPVLPIDGAKWVRSAQSHGLTVCGVQAPTAAACRSMPQRQILGAVGGGFEACRSMLQCAAACRGMPQRAKIFYFHNMSNL